MCCQHAAGISSTANSICCSSSMRNSSSSCADSGLGLGVCVLLTASQQQQQVLEMLWLSRHRLAAFMCLVRQMLCLSCTACHCLLWLAWKAAAAVAIACWVLVCVHLLLLLQQLVQCSRVSPLFKVCGVSVVLLLQALPHPKTQAVQALSQPKPKRLLAGFTAP